MLADWALDRQARKHGLRIAELTGCPMEPYEELLYCLRHVDVSVLKKAESDANVSSDPTLTNVLTKFISFLIYRERTGGMEDSVSLAAHLSFSTLVRNGY
jgi:hypothetical protein